MSKYIRNLIFSFIFTTISVSESVNFVEKVISTDILTPGSVIALDLDEDGDVDIVTASFNGDKVVWYENDGDQNFNEQIISANTDGPASIFVSDLDSDGDMDVLVACRYGDRVENWFENDRKSSIY